MDTGLYTILFGDTIQRLSLFQTVFLSAGILNAAGPVETKSEIVWNVLLLELDCLHICRNLHWKESRWLHSTADEVKESLVLTTELFGRFKN